MLSKKTRYAILALVRLAKEFGKEPLPISQISKDEMIPQRFLESILLDLKRTGILGSRLGKAGGYYLIKKPEEIILLEIVRRFEGGVAMLSCVSHNAYQPCEFYKDEAKCKIRKVFGKARDASAAILQKTTLADLV